MYTVRVGALYHPEITAWPETPHWRLSEDGVELLLSYRDPTPMEIRQVQRGRARFALLPGEHALILAYRFGELPWCDSPWQAARQTSLTAGLAQFEVLPRFAAIVVHVVLVNANTGIVKALRTASWSAGFVEALRAAIRTQLMNTSTVAQGNAEIDNWYARYGTVAELVRAAHVRT